MKQFFERYVFLNLKDYLNEELDMQPMLWALFLVIGLCVATFAMHCIKNAMYTTVKQTLRHKAQDTEHAKTVAELGLGSRRLIRFLLRRGDGQLFRALQIKGQEDMTYDSLMASERALRAENKQLRAKLRNKQEPLSEEQTTQLRARIRENRRTLSRKLDLAQARFYISDKTKSYAERVIDAGDEPIWQPIISSVALLALYVVIALLMPTILPLFA